jgi:hypothetical protein
MPDDRFVNCAKHGIRRCPMCSRTNQSVTTTPTVIPAVPNFDNPMESESEAKIMEGVFSPEPPFQIPECETVQKDPLVAAAEEYSVACRMHMAAQGAVARAKQALEDAKADEARSYKERIEAQTKLAELVAKTTEAVL